MNRTGAAAGRDRNNGRAVSLRFEKAHAIDRVSFGRAMRCESLNLSRSLEPIFMSKPE